MTYVIKRKLRSALGDKVDNADLANLLQHTQSNPVNPATFQDELTLNRLTVKSRDKIPVGADKYDSVTQEGEIGAVIATTRVVTGQSTLGSDIIHVSGTTYLIAYSDSSNDGWVASVSISADGATISVIDTLEFADSASVDHPRLVHIAGEVYAVAYIEGDSTSGTIATFTVTNAGVISNTIVDSGNFSDSRVETPISMLHVSGNVYAVSYGLYVSPNQDDGFVATISIDIDGTVGSIIDTLKFEDTYCNSPHFLRVGSSNFYAVFYLDSGLDGWVKTLEIDPDGSIAATVTDTLEFETASLDTLWAIHVNGDYYAVAYSSDGVFGKIATMTISNVGAIGNAVTSIGYFDFNDSTHVHIAHLTGDYFGIVYSGVDNDGWLSTIPISSAGIVGSRQDTLEFLPADTIFWPTLIHIDGLVYAIFYRAADGNGHIKTINIGSLKGAGYIWVEKDDGISFIGRSGTEGLAGDITKHATLDTGVHGVTGIVLGTEDVDDTPVNGASIVPVSSNWAYDHVVATDPHAPNYLKSSFMNGSFREKFDATVVSSGGTITMSLEQTGGGDLTMQFSDGLTTLDCTPADTIELTAGSDTSPQANWIYILQSGKVLAKSTTTWPATEHIRVGFFFCQSAASMATAGGPIINQNINDFLADPNSQGHLLHLAEKVRLLNATYFSGIDGNGTTGYLTITAGNVEFKSTAGVIFQLHKHTFPAFDTTGSGDTMHIKNESGDAYKAITNLHDITKDSTGATITNNKYFSLVFWGVQNKDGEHQTVLVNLPSGFYNTQADAESDASGYDDFTIPREFNIDSSSGFLIALVTIQMGSTWTHKTTVDLRGTTPQTASGGAAGIISSFADNVFDVFDESDTTKLLAFDVGTNVTTGNTRTVQVPDASGIMAYTSQTNGTIDHGADVAGLAGDDHTQYLLAAGSRALAGAWDMGSQNLTNVNIDSGTIAGVTLDGGLDCGGQALSNLGNLTSGDVQLRHYGNRTTVGGSAIEFFTHNSAGTDTIRWLCSGQIDQASMRYENVDVNYKPDGTNSRLLITDTAVTWSTSAPHAGFTGQLGGDLDANKQNITNIGDLISPTDAQIEIRGRRQAAGLGTIDIYTAGAAAGYTDTLRLRLTGGVATSTAVWSACTHTGMVLSDHLTLHVTDTDGTVEGDLWYDNSDDKLKVYTPGGVKTVQFE